MNRISPDRLGGNVFQTIGKQWMLVGASADGRVNAMTASWGGMGVLWNKNVVFVFLRPQRFTKTLVDKAEYFSLSFFGEEDRGMLTYMGRVSGRDEDKIAAQGLNFELVNGAPVFEKAQTTLICRKLYRQTLDVKCFIDGTIAEKNYPAKDWHDVYVAEITDIFTA